MKKNSKKNCWEIKKCGKGPAKPYEYKNLICPAATDTTLNGINRGKNGGRICWVVRGTFCNGEVQGTFNKKYGDCILCDVYKLIKKEEGTNFHVLQPHAIPET